MTPEQLLERGRRFTFHLEPCDARLCRVCRLSKWAGEHADDHYGARPHTFEALPCSCGLAEWLTELEALVRGAVPPAPQSVVTETPIMNCPRCDSPDPKRHPAVQFEGEVQECPHPWHQKEHRYSPDVEVGALPLPQEASPLDVDAIRERWDNARAGVHHRRALSLQQAYDDVRDLIAEVKSLRASVSQGPQEHTS